MKVKFFATISSIALLAVLASCSPGANTTAPEPGANTSTEVVDPCAAKDPCAADPCAAKDPCAADPCAAKDPCAGASNPCAGKIVTGGFFVEDGVAIKGTDPVAYFTENAPVQGSEEFAYEWQGATWHFSSAENRDKFAANPEQYAPQYGGYCAYAVSKGSTAPIDPGAWKIVDGKLYLNFDKSVQEKWEKDIPGYIEKANANWPGVLEKG
jgi:YHS domain-containing protein